ncbi:MAG: hypothetical protein RI923_286, partial [Pseudomonadota bacterium]
MIRTDSDTLTSGHRLTGIDALVRN